MFEYKAKLEKIVDGDTIDVTIDVGFKITTNQRIRFAKVNTAEIFHADVNSSDYKKGLEAKEYVERRFKENNNEMRLETYKWPGMHGRYTGIIWLADSKISLNDELIQQGLAEKVK